MFYGKDKEGDTALSSLHSDLGSLVLLMECLKVVFIHLQKIVFRSKRNVS